MRVLLWASLLSLGLPAWAVAHDIPNDVAIQTFIKPEGTRLRVLVRVPLVSMRDIDYPRRGPINSGLLDIGRADRALRDAVALWVADNLEVYEEDKPLGKPALPAVQASLPSDRSFATYDEAFAHLTGPRLPDEAEFVWSQGLLDALLEYPIRSDRSRFSIHPAFARLGLHTVTVVRFLPPRGGVRALEFSGDPGLIRLDPRWHQAALAFIRLGFDHILDGPDHLLFLCCLVIPFRRLRSLIAVITAFTVAHSMTLIASAYGLAPDALWFPPLVETLIAISIVYMAVENIVHAAADHAADVRRSRAWGPPSGLRRRWIVTFAFGLVHGFGFSFALRQTLQFAGTHLLTSLCSFNVGVELGQLLVLLVLVPALDVLFRFVVAERLGTIVLSAFVTHTAWHWTLDRAAALRQYRFEWPAFDLVLLATALRWAMIAVAGVGLYWLIFGVRRRPSGIDDGACSAENANCRSARARRLIRQ